MKQHLRFIRRVLFVTPLMASSALVAAPSQAATFAYSQGDFDFTNFSQRPLTIATDVNANTLAIGKGGMVKALSQATATFVTRPTSEASNFSLSQALGEGRDYLGQANTQATVIGHFVVDANTQWSVDFRTNLNLETSIDNPPAENARAAGDISFALIDTTNNTILDFFDLTGNVETLGDNDFIAFQKSDNVSLNNPLTTSNFGGNQESATASIQGSVQRYFANETNVALIEVKKNRARVVVPEPSTTLALLSCCSLLGVVTKAKRKAMTLVRSFKEKNC
ncbi:MAG: hypothetical protein KME49_28820 [Brasilonema octagenarum HA4186-MV1]|jgi:hypothetical protein|uniref:PEP-CTERM sorting domain-containing protein n=2 Tax=Brasilonema TaxID=383614 RepID=A0A856MK17_9CYAN|nr:MULTISPECIES: hypothetical protein [Brasilonema]MBW4629407.1 hypothetical protein [Brasilonema octagenarum HA4186-MV1]NMF63884.1 hypothetical protein [Brasilonema octagenarum UFV-OR1]QDL09951.1 hypothetical protein DP114_20510 [Brasilonema sennae CENA114]QDL16303.1 hypothetical protein DP113_20435 [Brasilonema octagenarum UFV-E1]